MKSLNLRKAHCLYVFIALCGVLCAVSVWIGHVVSLICLLFASVGMAGVLVWSFVLRKSIYAKLFYLFLFLVALGNLMGDFGWESVKGWVLFCALLCFVVLIYRFVYYVNLYCQKDAEKRLDEME